jgi:hypothetical protein
MGYVQNLRTLVENARFAEMIDEQVAKFRKETKEMRVQEDEQRAERLVKHRRAAVWVSKPEALAHIPK